MGTRDENSSNSVDLTSNISQYNPEEGEEDYSYYHDDDEEEEDYDDDLDTIGMDLAAIARGMQTVSLTREDVHHSIEPHHAIEEQEHEEEETSRRLELSREGRELISNSLSQDDIEHALATSIALHQQQQQQQQQQHQARCSEPYEEEEKMDRKINVQ